MAGICDKFEKISRLDRAEDVTFILNTTCKSIFQAYSLYSNGSSIAKIVTAEEFTRSFAKTMAAPNRLGVVKAGSTAAKSVSAAMAAAGIGLGIYDIIGGSEELKGNMADGFLDAAIAVTGATDLIKQIIYFATGRAVPFEGLILMGNQALDIVDETTDELCMFRIHGELNQRWELTDDQHLRSKINGKVLDVENGTLRVKTRQDAVNPKWKFENGRLHNVTTGGTLHVSHDRQLGTQPSTATVGAELHVASALNEDLVLEIRDGEDRTGAWVVLWPRHGGRNQVWKMMENGQLKSMMNGKVMDVWKERAVEDAKIRMHTPLGDGDRNQQWRLTNGYLESKMSSDLVMDLRGSSVHQGNKVRLANKTDASSQKWVLRPLSQQNVFLGQEVTISSLEQSGRVMDIRGASNERGAWVILYDKHGGPNQRWVFLPSGEIMSMLNGKVLDVWKGRAVEDAKIRMHGPNGDANQQWFYNNGHFESRMDRSLVLDLRPGRKGDTKLRLARKGDRASQKWEMGN